METGRGRDFSPRHRIQTDSAPPQPPLQGVPGAVSPGVKRPSYEADRSPPSSAEVNNEWSCTSAPHKNSWRGAQLYTNITLLLPLSSIERLDELEWTCKEASVAYFKCYSSTILE
jgi:hypothetical protein